MTAIRALADGGGLFSNALVLSLLNRAERKGGGQVNMFGLTTRELEILRQIGSGFSNKDIARRRPQRQDGRDASAEHPQEDERDALQGPAGDRPAPGAGPRRAGPDRPPLTQP